MFRTIAALAVGALLASGPAAQAQSRVMDTQTTDRVLDSGDASRLVATTVRQTTAAPRVIVAQPLRGEGTVRPMAFAGARTAPPGTLAPLPAVAKANPQPTYGPPGASAAGPRSIFADPPPAAPAQPAASLASDAPGPAAANASPAVVVTRTYHVTRDPAPLTSIVPAPTTSYVATSPHLTWSVPVTTTVYSYDYYPWYPGAYYYTPVYYGPSYRWHPRVYTYCPPRWHRPVFCHPRAGISFYFRF